MSRQTKIGFLLLFLAITVKTNLFGLAPNWQVNPAAYQYNMTGIFRVMKNSNTYMNEAGSKVGIFVGTQIRGVVNGSDIIFVAGNAYFPATMYSNTQSGDVLTFKVYVPSVDSVFDATETAVFDRSQTLGTPQNPFLLHITTCVNVLTLTSANSPLSGTYRAIQEIRLQGNTIVNNGSTVTFDAPIIRSQNQFLPKPGSQVIIKTAGCL